MKRIATSLMLLCLCIAASAQDIFDNPDRGARLGVRLGLDIATSTDFDFGRIKLGVLNAGAGFTAGAVYNIPVWKNMYFEPGLLLFYNSMGYDITISDESSAPDTGHCSLRRFGVRVPFRLDYRFDFEKVSVRAFTGPQLEVGLIGRSRLEVGNESASENAYGSDGTFNRVNVGWEFGAGVDYGNWTAEISGAAGITDMVQGSAIKGRFNNVTISLGYNF